MNRDRRLSDQLRKDGYRVTRQRQAILDEMREQDGHLTAREIYDSVKEAMPQISLGTVYRSLSVLEQLRLVRRLPGNGSARYDANTTEHFHITCVSCGRVMDVSMGVVGEINESMITATGYQLTGFDLELFGKCATCQGQTQ